MLAANRVRPVSVRLAGRRFFTASTSRCLLDTGERLILGIESSCDDSCASLIAAPPDYSAVLDINLSDPQSSRPRPQARLINSIVVRQNHERTKGIEALNAQHAHLSGLPKAVSRCLSEGQISSSGSEVDAIAVTLGPGFPGCVGVGLSVARTLAALWDKPLIPVHHMEAHMLTPFMTSSSMDKSKVPLAFPFLTYLLSGGHTMLVLARGVGKYKILANTIDYAIGAALDRASSLLCIPTDWSRQSPGAALEAFAAGLNSGRDTGGGPDPATMSRPKYRRGFRNQPTFEYAGLRGELGRFLMTETGCSSLHEDLRAAARSFPLEQRRLWAADLQSEAFDQLEEKIRLVLTAASATPQHRSSQSSSNQKSATTNLPAEWQVSEQVPDAAAILDELRQVKYLVVSGGVASNQELRRRLADVWRADDGRHLVFPPVSLCVDNAAMIANVGALVYSDDAAVQSRMSKVAWESKPLGKWSLEDVGRYQ